MYSGGKRKRKQRNGFKKCLSAQHLAAHLGLDLHMYDHAASQRLWKQQELRDMSKLWTGSLYSDAKYLFTFSGQPLFNPSLQTNEDEGLS